MTRIRADFSNQQDYFNPDAFATRVNLVGLGSIGSNLLAWLAKMGVPEIHAWDDDHVEAHNVPVQSPYRLVDVGMLKVEAAAAYLDYMGSLCQFRAHAEKANADTEFEGVVMTGLDTMAARQDVWRAVKENPKVPLLIDGRLGSLQISMLTVAPLDFAAAGEYQKFLFGDEQAAQLPCAARAMIPPAGVLVSLMADQLAKFSRGEEDLQFHVQGNLATPYVRA